VKTPRRRRPSCYAIRRTSATSTRAASSAARSGEGFGIAWARGYAYVGGEAGPRFLLERPLKPPSAPTGRGEAFVSQIDDLDYVYLPMITRR